MTMAVKLHNRGFQLAKAFINEGRFVFDERDAWSEHQPSAAGENRFVQEHGLEEYGLWHLGIDDEAGENTKGRYWFPYGDFEKVHRCGLLSAESRAGQRKYFGLELAIAHLHGMLEAVQAQTALASKSQ